MAEQTLLQTGLSPDAVNLPDYLSDAVYQFASPAKAGTFFSSVRACMTGQGGLRGGVDTTPVMGDQAVTAVIQSTVSKTGITGRCLFVLHGTDVLALAARSDGASTH